MKSTQKGKEKKSKIKRLRIKVKKQHMINWD
jgi:hypothetical protein